MGALPAAVASIYQERMFSKAKVHLLGLMFHSSLAQFVILLLVSPLMFIPKFGNVSPANFGPHISAAAQCLMGTPPPAHLGYGDQVDCSQAGILLLSVVAFMLLANFASAATTQYASASFMIFVSTVVTPISSFAFTIRPIMHSHTESLTVYSYVALVLLIIGIFAFRYFDVEQFEERELEPLLTQKSPSSSGPHSSSSPSHRPSSTSSPSSGIPVARIPVSRPMYIPRAGIITLNTADPSTHPSSTPFPVIIPSQRPHSYTSRPLPYSAVLQHDSVASSM